MIPPVDVQGSSMCTPTLLQQATPLGVWALQAPQPNVFTGALQSGDVPVLPQAFPPHQVQSPPHLPPGRDMDGTRPSCDSGVSTNDLLAALDENIMREMVTCAQEGTSREKRQRSDVHR